VLLPGLQVTLTREVKPAAAQSGALLHSTHVSAVPALMTVCAGQTAGQEDRHMCHQEVVESRECRKGREAGKKGTAEEKR
jgi:hypothetical protein